MKNMWWLPGVLLILAGIFFLVLAITLLTGERARYGRASIHLALAILFVAMGIKSLQSQKPVK